MVVRVLPITLWERLNAWLFAAVLILALLLAAAASHAFDTRLALCVLAPQIIYVGMVLDTVVVVAADIATLATTSNDPCAPAIRSGLYVRATTAALVVAANVCLVLSMLVVPTTFRDDERRRAVFVALVVAVIALAVCALIEVASVVVALSSWSSQRIRGTVVRNAVGVNEMAAQSQMVLKPRSLFLGGMLDAERR